MMHFPRRNSLLRALLVLSVCLLGIWAVVRGGGEAPLVNPGGFSQALYAANGELLRLTLAADEKFRLWTPLNQISPALLRATLGKEDRYFYFHCGVNPFSLARAALATYIDRKRRIGGSTIMISPSLGCGYFLKS